MATTKNNSRINKMLNSISRSSNNNYTSKSILYCRWVLYVVFLLAIGNIYYLLLGGDYFTLAIFVLVAFLTTFFSKNMVVILCISLVISTIIKSVQVKEGLQLSKGDLNTIETLMNKFGGGLKEGASSKNNNDNNTTDMTNNNSDDSSNDNSSDNSNDNKNTNNSNNSNSSNDNKNTNNSSNSNSSNDNKNTNNSSSSNNDNKNTNSSSSNNDNKNKNNNNNNKNNKK
jgi:hypothetical protein